MTAQLPLHIPGVPAPAAGPTGPAHYTLHNPVLSFHVYGLPIPEGRVSSYGPGQTGWSNAKTLKPWRKLVKETAQRVLAGSAVANPDLNFPIPQPVPVGLRLTFSLPKPLSAPKTTRLFPTRRPDLSHLLRAIEDSLTDAGVWQDDSQIVDSAERKVFVGEHPLALDQPGVRIRVYHITATPTEPTP